MNCQSCGARLPPDSESCPACGQSQGYRVSATQDGAGSNRPLGVSLIVFVGVLNLAVLFFATIALLGLAEGGTVPTLVLVALVGFIGVYAAMLYGLWHLTAWGYTLAVLNYLLGIPVFLLYSAMDLLYGVIGLIINVAILLYIVSVDRYFKH